MSLTTKQIPTKQLSVAMLAVALVGGLSLSIPLLEFSGYVSMDDDFFKVTPKQVAATDELVIKTKSEIIDENISKIVKGARDGTLIGEGTRRISDMPEAGQMKMNTPIQVIKNGNTLSIPYYNNLVIKQIGGAIFIGKIDTKQIPISFTEFEQKYNDGNKIRYDELEGILMVLTGDTMQEKYSNYVDSFVIVDHPNVSQIEYISDNGIWVTHDVNYINGDLALSIGTNYKPTGDLRIIFNEGNTVTIENIVDELSN